MVNSISVHVIHATDASQHLGFLTQILEAFKSENRINQYSTIAHDVVTDTTFESLGEDDMVITLLTKELIGLQAGIENALITVKQAKPKYKMVEVIVDNIPYHPDFIALPTSLEPIRDSEDMDGVWNGIGMALREIFPERETVDPPPPWKKYIPHLVGLLLLAGIGFGIWKSGILTTDPKAAFSYTVLDPIKGDIIGQAEECYLPCKVLLNNKSKNAKKIIWDLKDTIIENVDEPIHVFLEPANYKLKLTALNGKSKSDSIITLKVKAPPFANFEITNNGCTAPCSIGFKNTSKSATKYSWSFAGIPANSDLKENPGTRHYNTEGKFKVTLQVENEDGIKADTIQEVTILKDHTPFPEFKAVKIAGGTTPKQRFKFENLSKNGSSFVWNFGDGTLPKTVADTRALNHDFKAYGTYAVTLKVIGVGGVVREFVQPVNVRSKFIIGKNIGVYDAKVFKDVMKTVKKSTILPIKQ